jgi:hypothetical protein
VNAELQCEDILALLDIPTESEDEADSDSKGDLEYSILFGRAWCRYTT